LVKQLHEEQVDIAKAPKIFKNGTHIKNAELHIKR
ncbi:hypothetical protein Q604_UNBC16886G0001, partial [human gut metagenome]